MPGPDDAARASSLANDEPEAIMRHDPNGGGRANCL
jgi:hypothetical protein